MIMQDGDNGQDQWTLKQLEKVICNLNMSCKNQMMHTGLASSPFVLHTDGECTHVTFFDYPLWDNDGNTFQTIEQVEADIVDEAKSLLEAIQSLNFQEDK